MDIDFRKIMGCTCLRMRRATRRVTQLYDHALQPAELTINQFGLLAYLRGATLTKSNPPSIGTMAEWLGMDPTTLNRNLKPLIARGLVRSTPDPADGRVRVVRTTDKGQRTLLKAVPLWQQAQTQVEAALGGSKRPRSTACWTCRRRGLSRRTPLRRLKEQRLDAAASV